MHTRRMQHEGAQTRRSEGCDAERQSSATRVQSSHRDAPSNRGVRCEVRGLLELTRAASVCLHSSMRSPIMSASKPAFKPGQSAKKATSTPRSSSAAAAPRSAAKGKQSLAQQIAELSNPTPKDFDPEDDDTNGVATRITDDYDAMEEDEVPKLLRSATPVACRASRVALLAAGSRIASSLCVQPFSVSAVTFARTSTWMMCLRSTRAKW